MEIGRVDLAGNTEGGLVRQQIAKGAGDGFLDGASDPTGGPALAGPRGQAHFHTVESHRPIAAHGGGVDGPRWERIGGDQVAAALLGDTNEMLLARLIDEVAKGCLIVLEGTHLL